MKLDQMAISGWDISDFNIYDGAIRGQVLEPELLDKMKPLVEGMKPLPSVYYSDFIASN
jgi:myo-inositol-1-phosphate synthase